MAKKIDITEKLSFDENPRLVVGDLELEVNSDAETMLLLMGVFSEKDDMHAVTEALGLIFNPDDVEKLCGLENKGKKLSAKSLMAVIEAAMGLVMGEDDQGE